MRICPVIWRNIGELYRFISYLSGIETSFMSLSTYEYKFGIVVSSRRPSKKLYKSKLFSTLRNARRLRSYRVSTVLQKFIESLDIRLLNNTPTTKAVEAVEVVEDTF